MKVFSNKIVSIIRKTSAYLSLRSSPLVHLELFLCCVLCSLGLSSYTGCGYKCISVPFPKLWSDPLWAAAYVAASINEFGDSDPVKFPREWARYTKRIFYLFFKNVRFLGYAKTLIWVRLKPNFMNHNLWNKLKKYDFSSKLIFKALYIRINKV